MKILNEKHEYIHTSERMRGFIGRSLPATVRFCARAVMSDLTRRCKGYVDRSKPMKMPCWKLFKLHDSISNILIPICYIMLRYFSHLLFTNSMFFSNELVL